MDGESWGTWNDLHRSCCGIKHKRHSRYIILSYVYMIIYVDIHIYIYISPKPGRSPTRQYSVLSCFFPSRPASDFFLDFKKHLLLAVPANQVHQAEKHLKG